MVGNYCIQFHDKRRALPMRETVFENFTSLTDWLKSYDSNTADAINVHLPVRATDEERRTMHDLGLVAN